MNELKQLIEQQGEAFAAFRGEVDELKGKLPADPIDADRLSKIETSLDAAVEGKAALEARIAAEAKQREDLELRLQREGIKGDGDAAKTELELKTFNRSLQALGQERKTAVAPLDREGFAEYKAALDSYVRRGRDGLGAEEIKALSVGLDTDGGYLVTPDMSGRIATRVFETSPIRQIANVQVISSDKLEGIEDINEAGGGWSGETATRSETSTPDVGRWSIEAFEVYAEPKATQKLLDDAMVDAEAWLSGKIGDKLGRLENTAHVVGDGIQKPRGFGAYTTAADDGSGVTWGTIGHVNTGANGAFATSNPGDVLHDLVGLLKNEYLTGSSFVTRRSVITAIRKFKDGQGQYLWQPGLGAGQPEQLVGYPITRAEDIATAATGSLSLFFGNFREAYQIVDRQGERVLRDPYTQKGYVKFYTTRRTGGAVVNFEAIKALRFSAS